MAQPGHTSSHRPRRALAPRVASIPESLALGSGAAEEIKTKRASTACKECKRRRTRCSTGNPCSQCAAHGRECVYDEHADKRRKVAAKRTQEELEYYRDFVESLIDSIRYCEPGHIDQIINVIRSRATTDEILSVVKQSLNQVEIHKKDKTQGGEAEVGEGNEEMIESMEDPPQSPPASYGAYHPSKEAVNSPLTSIPQRLRYK
ncbi:hypothetical protein Egran_05089 [Elaphomyces granulatus]|uniref:Zn(2)-C6 fungal-type domain-containing protein n=1 Tax=Elaphomyces granulatus TaxID=519963 RepID=A0A232LSU9_9EURO|nr:hypothetical protein Egran_05089 [Elaphomyces granulatus]